MALIQCPTCGHSVSDKAVRCPRCGQPIGMQTQQTPSYNANAYPVENMNSGNKGKKTAIIIVSVVAAILAIVVVALVIHINNRPSYSPDSYTEDYFDEDLVTEEPDASDESTLEAIIRYANQDFPEEIEEGMTMTKITLEGDYIVYYCSVDEDLYSISAIRTAQNEIKKEIKNTLYEMDGSEDFLDVCRSNNKGVAYKYVGIQSGNSHTIYIRPSEI